MSGSRDNLHIFFSQHNNQELANIILMRDTKHYVERSKLRNIYLREKKYEDIKTVISKQKIELAAKIHKLAAMRRATQELQSEMDAENQTLQAIRETLQREKDKLRSLTENSFDTTQLKEEFLKSKQLTAETRRDSISPIAWNYMSYDTKLDVTIMDILGIPIPVEWWDPKRVENVNTIGKDKLREFFEL